MSLVYLCVVKSQEETGSVHGPVSIVNKMAAETKTNARTVCNIVHSYIRHLIDLFTNSVLRMILNLDMDSFTMDFRSRIGLTFERLAHCPEFLQFNTPPDLCFIQLEGMTCARIIHIRFVQTLFRMYNFGH